MAFVLTACGEKIHEASLERVRDSRTIDGQDLAAMVQQLAGAQGRVHWALGVRSGSRQSVVVTVQQFSAQQSSVVEELILEFVHDVDDDQVTLAGVLRQSEALSVVDGALAMLAMRLNSVTGGVQMGEVSEGKNGQP